MEAEAAWRAWRRGQDGLGVWGKGVGKGGAGGKGQGGATGAGTAGADASTPLPLTPELPPAPFA
jgi:hypothetical protein